MKQYFAKYISQEGCVKKGDKFIALKDPSTKERVFTCDYLDDSLLNYSEPVIRYSRGVEPSENFYFQKDTKLVKLCLCSRDIQVGDEITWIEKIGYENRYLGELPGRISDQQDIDIVNNSEKELICIGYKVIGEISNPEIVEGQEFTEGEIQSVIGINFYKH